MGRDAALRLLHRFRRRAGRGGARGPAPRVRAVRRLRGRGGAGGDPDPNAATTFAASKVDWAARETPAGRDWLAFTRSLLDIRHREIVPHLAQAPGHGGRLLLAEDGRVAVDWRLDGAILRLRANLYAAPADLPGAAGRILYGTAGPSAVPRSVLVTLETGA